MESSFKKWMYLFKIEEKNNIHCFLNLKYSLFILLVTKSIDWFLKLIVNGRGQEAVYLTTAFDFDPGIQ